MCGIAGIVYQDLNPTSAATAVRQMIALQKHRGPDGVGFYNDPGVSFGHARLAIIDLSNAGEQPMSDPEHRFWLILNGEIYNYVELRKELISLGHVLHGHSDTEVLLHAYMQWGEGCVSRLRGMFAFAIWDKNEKRLFAGRDRLGIKPFHYWLDVHGNLFFSSEIKALLPFIQDRKINIQLAEEYIAWNLLEHEPTQTMFVDVKRLAPGHTLIWKPRQGVRIVRYWQLEKPDQQSMISGQSNELFHEFRERFDEVIHIHLRADIPIGTSLSGGLDSSAIVGTINKQSHTLGFQDDGWQQHVFSARFEDPELDERRYIDAVVKMTGVEPHYVFPSGEQLRIDMEDWMWHQEEPVGGTNPYAQYCVARLAKQNGIKVLLDGQGADELLGGYRKFILVYLKELLHHKKYLTAAQEGFSFFLNPEILRTSRIVDGRRYLRNVPSHASILWKTNAYPKRRSALELGNSLRDRVYQDIMYSSLPLLLRYEDRNSMAFGVEARVPFVDHEFVEWLYKLPSDMLLHRGWTKYILRESLSDVLPTEVKKRKTKLGFSTPEPKWLAGSLKPWVEEMLESPNYLHSIVEPLGVQQLLINFQSGPFSPSLYNLIFRLAITESWARQFFGEKIPMIRL